MSQIIYNIDPNGQVTPLMVRDAIVECFWEAHCRDSGMDEIDKEANKTYCKSIVEKAFKDTNGDFNSPNKESIVNCLNALAAFSKSFRDPSIIAKNYSELMLLVNKL